MDGRKGGRVYFEDEKGVHWRKKSLKERLFGD